MKLEDLRLFGDRCIVQFINDGFDWKTGTVVAVGPDSLVEVGDEIMFAAYYTDFWVEEENGPGSKHAVLDQVQVVATIGAKPAVELPELEPLPPPTDAERERFNDAAEKAMADQRAKLGLPEEKCNQGVPGCSGDGSRSKPHSGAHHLALNATAINPAVRDIHSPKALNQGRMTDLFSIERGDRRGPGRNGSGD